MEYIIPSLAALIPWAVMSGFISRETTRFEFFVYGWVSLTMGGGMFSFASQVVRSLEQHLL